MIILMCLKVNYGDSLLNMLFRKKGGTSPEFCNYDANRMSKSDAVGSSSHVYAAGSNRLQSVSGVRYALDAAGNTTRSDIKRMTYSANNRMTRFKDASTGAVSDYYHNGLGVKGAGGVSPIEFEDGYQDFNPKAYEGTAYYASLFYLGDALIYGVSPFIGFDFSVGGGAGVSVVQSFVIR